MNVWESIRTAWKSIFSNKLRSSLTMLGIIIGVSAVVLLVALGTGFQNSMQQTFEDLGASALYVYSSTDKAVKPYTFDRFPAGQGYKRLTSRPRKGDLAARPTSSKRCRPRGRSIRQLGEQRCAQPNDRVHTPTGRLRAYVPVARPQQCGGALILPCVDDVPESAARRHRT